MSDDTTPLDHWNKRYITKGYLFGTTPNAFLTAQAHRLRAGQKVLAIADGEGRNGVYLAKQGLEVHSVDFSPVALAKAEKLAQDEGVRISCRRLDLFTHEFEADKFDAVVAIFIQFASPENRPYVFSQMIRALKPGGLLILQGYRPEQVDLGTGGPPHRENMYTEELLREAFDDLDILEMDSYDAEIDEGAGHRGMSALIGMVAQKPNVA